jgi:hypothetical protein
MKKFALFIAFLLLLLGSYAQAQTTPFCQGVSCTYTALEPLPLGPNYSNCYGAANAECRTPVNFQGLVSASFKLLLGAGAAIAIVMLILGALTYMFSDIVKNKATALARIRGAMWAIVLLVSSYLILNTINPDLVTFKLNLSSINSPFNPSAAPPALQNQEAINNAALQQCQNQSNTTRLCTWHYRETGSSGECLCSNF